MNAIKMFKKQINKGNILLAVLYGFFIALGSRLEKRGEVFCGHYEKLFGVFLLATLLSYVGIFFLDRLFSALKLQPAQMKLKARSYFFFCWISILAIYLIVLLGVYPGFFCYDAPDQWEMFLYQQVTAHHPVIHTYCMGLIIASFASMTHSFNFGVFMFVLIQNLIISGCIAYIMLCLYQKKIPVFLRRMIYICFVFFPTNIINNMSVTKDSFFTLPFILFLFLTYEMIGNEEDFWKLKRNSILWLLAGFGALITRNNMVYVLFPMLLLFWFYVKNKKKYMINMLIFCGIFLVYSGPFTKLVTVEGTKPREFLSIPCQQLVRTYIYHSGEMDSDKERMLEELFEEYAFTYYQPKIADITKICLREDVFFQNPVKYIKLYCELALKYPSEYLDAFLINTYGSWYPKASLALFWNGMEGYLICYSYSPAESHSLIPFVFRFFSLFNDSDLVMGNKVWNVPFLPGTFFFAFLYAFFTAIRCREKKFILPGILILLYWMTFLLGPVALVRYVSFLYYLFPLEMAAVYSMMRPKA